MSTINRLYKDRLFRLLFADEKNKANALALYNALNNSNYTNVNELEFNTLDNVIHLGMKNDLSFIVADSYFIMVLRIALLQKSFDFLMLFLFLIPVVNSNGLLLLST